ncbi:MAG: RidA family protein [Parvibaculaceae bacterium]
MRYVTTDKAAKPFSRYSQAVVLEDGERLVFISGQVGVSASGELAPTSSAQHEAVWSNILAILESEGLGPQHLVDVTGYITDPAELPAYRAARDKALNGAAPASTLLVVQGLADPRWKVEISAVAAATG